MTQVDEAIGSLREVVGQAQARPGLLRDVDRLEREADDDDATSQRLTVERERDIPTRLLWCTAELEQRSREFEEAYFAANAQREALIQERVDGMAGELADRLIGGGPCPVCGATEHPQPAVASELAVTPADIEAAGRRVESVSAKRLAIMPDVTAARALTKHMVASAEEAVDVAGDPAAVLAEVQTRLAVIAEELPRLAERSSANRTLAVQQAEAIAAIDRKLGSALGGFATVEERLVAVAAMRADVVVLRDAIDLQVSAVRIEVHAQAALANLDEPVHDERGVCHLAG